jgi:hypothetical protein
MKQLFDDVQGFDDVSFLIRQFMNGSDGDRDRSLPFLATACHCDDPEVSSRIAASRLFPALVASFLTFTSSIRTQSLQCISGLLSSSTAYHHGDILELLVEALPPWPPAGRDVEILPHLILSLRAFFVNPQFQDFFFEQELLLRFVDFYGIDVPLDGMLMLIAQDCAGANLEHEHAVGFVKASMEVVAEHTAENVARILYLQVSADPRRFNSPAIQACALNLFKEFPSSRPMLIECCRYIDERGVAFFEDEDVSQTLCEFSMHEDGRPETVCALRALARFVQIAAARAEVAIFKREPRVLPQLVRLIVIGQWSLKTWAIRLIALILQNRPRLFDELVGSENGSAVLATLFLEACASGCDRAIEYFLIGLGRYARQASLEYLAEMFLCTPECMEALSGLFESENEDIQILANVLYEDHLRKIVDPL